MGDPGDRAPLAPRIPEPDPGATIVDDLARAAAATPGKPAVIAYHPDRPEPERVTFAELATRVERVACGLAALGLGPGDVVSVQLPTRLEFVIVHHAVARVGAITNPITPILRRREVESILRRSQSGMFVGVREHRGYDIEAMIAELRPRLPALQEVLFVGDSFERRLCEPAWEERHPPAALAALAPSAQDLYELQYTSGTTGEAKGVLHTHASIGAGMASVPRLLGLSDDDVFVMASTFGHQTGFIFGCCLPVRLGATVVLVDGWEPGTVLERAAGHRATWTSLAPAMAHDLCDAAAAGGPPLDAMRSMRVSGAFVPPQLVELVAERLHTELLPSWGLTETGVCTHVRPGEASGTSPSDGAPVPGVDVRVGVPDGRIHVRTPGMFAGYLGAVERPFDEDGWFDTGDLAVSDGRGGIRISGRHKDLIIRGGENIPVGQIEGLLSEHPAVARVALIAVPDERLGERACAVDVAVAGATPRLVDVTRHLEGLGVAKQFWPERLEIVDELPLTVSGKVRKGVLRERFRTGAREAAEIDHNHHRQKCTGVPCGAEGPDTP